MSNNKIIDTSKSLYEVLETLGNKKIIIPKYQRSYSWESLQVEELLNDLFYNEKNGSQWYLGPIFITKNNDSIELIDGQQRITSIYLILKELLLYTEVNSAQLYKASGENNDLKVEFNSYSKEQLGRLVLVGNESRLVLDQGNDDFFQIYIKSNDPNEGYRKPNKKSQKLMNAAIETIRSRLAKEIKTDINRFKGIIKFISSGNKIEVLEVEINSKTDFYRIFEGINDRGRALSDSDKFKNLYLIYTDEDKHGNFEKKWFDNLEKIQSVNKEFKNIFKYLPLSDGVDTTKPYVMIKEEVEKKNTKSLKQDLLKEKFNSIKRQIKGIVSIYSENGDNISSLFFNNIDGLPKEIKDRAKRITLISRIMWNEYDQFGIIFYGLIKNYSSQNDEDIFRDFLKELSLAIKYLLILSISGKKPQEIRPKLIGLINNYIKKSKSIIKPFREVRDDFKSNSLKASDLYRKSNPNFSGLILTLIQSHFNENYINEHIETRASQMSLEHFVPRNWKTNWKTIEKISYKKLNKDYKNLLDDKILNERYLEKENNDHFVLEHIGNKLWLKQDTNASLGYKSFNDKKKIIKDRGVIYFPNKVKGLVNIDDSNDFSLDDIMERTKIISEKIKIVLLSENSF